METNNLAAFLENNYSEYLEPISELSKSDTGKVLVNDNRKLYNFDKITKCLYLNNLPESADAIYSNARKIYLVEYKSGFKKRVNRQNFDKRRMSCYDDETKYCEAYAELFFKNQDNEHKILRDSIRIKALESYMTVTQEILSEIDDYTEEKLIFCVVIDAPIETMEATLNTLAGKESEDNAIENTRKSLLRFRKNEHKGYYYDEIEVFSPHEFQIFLNSTLAR